MYKITNIDTLGTQYTVADQNGNIIKTVQIVLHTDILDAALGEFDNEKYSSISEYMKKSIELLSGYEKINPYKVLWHSTTEKDIVLIDIMEYAVKYGYDRIILEYIED